MAQPVQRGAGQQPAAGGMGAPGGSAPGLRPVGIDEVLQTDVVTVERSTPIPTVVAEMAEEDVGSVVVVEDDVPVGILTDREVALALETHPDLPDLTAQDLLAGDPITGDVEMSVFDALAQLESAEIRRLPILEEDGTLRGIVTLDDILVLLGTELGHATAIIEAQSPRL